MYKEYQVQKMDLLFKNGWEKYSLRLDLERAKEVIEEGKRLDKLHHEDNRYKYRILVREVSDWKAL